MEKEFIGGIDEYQSSVGKKRNKMSTIAGNVAKRICPHCRSSSRYCGIKQYCDNCGKKYEDFVVKSAEELKNEKNNEKKSNNY